MGYVYRDPRRAENLPTVAPEPKPPAPPAEVQVHPKVKALLDRQKARIQELEAENAALGKKVRLATVAEAKALEKAKALQGELDAACTELTAAAENYDSLASVNQNLQEAAAKASERANKADRRPASSVLRLTPLARSRLSKSCLKLRSRRTPSSPRTSPASKAS